MAATAALTAASIGIAGASSFMGASQKNAQIQYQQDVAHQNAIFAQNKAAAEMKTRRNEALRQNASTLAAMSAKGVDASSGTFLDFVGQGAAAGELDVLKAKYEGDMEAWDYHQQINELQSQKKNAWLEAGLAGAKAGLNSVATKGAGVMGELNKFGNSIKTIGKTSGGSGIVGMDAIEGTIA